MFMPCICSLNHCLYVYMCSKHYGIFKRRDKESVGEQVCTCQLTVPKVKIAFVLFYWIVYCLMLFPAISLRAGRDNTFNYHLRSYVDCMAGGSRKFHDCYEQKSDLEAETNPMAEVFLLTLSAFLNFASLPFVIQFQTIKNTVNSLQARR